MAKDEVRAKKLSLELSSVLSQISELEKRSNEIARDLLLAEKGFTIGDYVSYKGSVWKVTSRVLKDTDGRIVSAELYRETAHYGPNAFKKTFPSNEEFKEIEKA